jgi:hypothetical protein
MLMEFDIKKAIAAAAYLISRKGGQEGMFVLIKKLYWADRTALVKWGKSITGDSLSSMDKGPVVSTIYDLLKGNGPDTYQIEWDNAILRKRKNFGIFLRKPADTASLSEREMEVLNQASLTIDSIRGSIPLWLHKHCPEWTDPHGSSIPIDPSQVLRLAKKTEEEIRKIEELNDEVRLMNRLLNPRRLSVGA